MALQLSVLNYNKQVINLEAKEVLKFMEDQPFTEVRRYMCITSGWNLQRYVDICIT